MSIGFRKSIFGFNCNDVIEYIERTHKKFRDKTDALNKKADELSTQLNLSKEQYEVLLEEKNIISEKLNAFTEKCEEIERLSENIGKLYLVSQANAQAIIDNSNDSARISNIEVEKNINAIDQAHISLNELRESILNTSNEFVNEVDALLCSLDNTREKIKENTLKCEEHNEQFESVFESIVSE